MPEKRPSAHLKNPRSGPRTSHPIAAAFGTLALLAFGIMTILFGKRAIVSEYFEYPNQLGPNLTIGSLGFNDDSGEFRILEGPEAIYWGIAFCALGVMFALWGCGIGLSIFTPK